MINDLDSFFPVVILQACKFKYSVSFGTHTPLDRSSIVLQLPIYPYSLGCKLIRIRM